jgi:hypothetical protein
VQVRAEVIEVESVDEKRIRSQKKREDEVYP